MMVKLCENCCSIRNIANQWKESQYNRHTNWDSLSSVIIKKRNDIILYDVLELSIQ